jgi:hypothetical protein
MPRLQKGGTSSPLIRWWALPQSFNTFDEFWRFYLREHAQPETPRPHIAGKQGERRLRKIPGNPTAARYHGLLAPRWRVMGRRGLVTSPLKEIGPHVRTSTVVADG